MIKDTQANFNCFPLPDSVSSPEKVQGQMLLVSNSASHFLPKTSKPFFVWALGFLRLILLPFIV